MSYRIWRYVSSILFGLTGAAVGFLVGAALGVPEMGIFGALGGVLFAKWVSE